MKIKEGFVVKNISGENLVIPIGKTAIDFKAMIKINETGLFLWELLNKGVTFSQLVEALCKEYDIDNITAESDITLFLEKLREAKILENE